MELVVVEGAFGFDIAGALGDGHDAVGDGPFGGRGAVLRGDPLVEILAVEQDDRVGRRRGAGGGRSDDLGLGRPDFCVFGLGRGRGLLGGDGSDQGDEESEGERKLVAHDVQEDTPAGGVWGRLVKVGSPEVQGLTAEDAEIFAEVAERAKVNGLQHRGHGGSQRLAFATTSESAASSRC